MSDEETEAAPIQNPAAHFSGNIMNFQRPKFNARLENRHEAIKAFKKKCAYIFKGSLVNISEERKCILVQDWLGPEGQKIYDSLDWGEDEDVNNYELMWTKLEGVISAECNEIVKVKVKSACEPSGPSGRSLSRFLLHEATRSISTPPWMGC